MSISMSDRERLRTLAAQQMELANSEAMKTLRAEWEMHGDPGKHSRPMTRIELWTFEPDIIPQLMRCEGEEARKIERKLLHQVVNHTLFGDDTLVQDCYPVQRNFHFQPFGLEVKRERTDGVGHHFIPYLVDLEEDFHKLKPSVYGVDDTAAKAEIERVGDVIGDIVPVRLMEGCLGACPTQDIVHIMSMEDMYVAMLDTPELFGEMMEMLTKDYMAYFKMLESGGYLTSAAKSQHLNQGTYCYTSDLPEGKAKAALKDMWLYMDSQETSSISPELYRELVFPYYQKLMEPVGLVSYGCCEAVDKIWGGCLGKVQNLRKVSISPWCDEPAMGEFLKGSSITYLRKPSPNLIGVGAALDEQAVIDHIRATAIAARGCKLEIAQRDVYEIHNTSEKVRRYVELIRQTVDEYWQ